MFSRAVGEREDNPVLREVLAPFFAYWERVHAVLCAPWKVSGRARIRVRALVGPAISFQTWRSLALDQKLKDADAVNLLVKVVSCVGSKGAAKS